MIGLNRKSVAKKSRKFISDKRELSVNKTDLRALSLVRDNPVTDPLAVLHLDN